MEQQDKMNDMKMTDSERFFKVEEFMQAWKQQNPPLLHAACTLTWKSMHKIEQTFEMMAEAKVQEYEIVGEKQLTAVIYEVEVSVMATSKKGGNSYQTTIKCRCIKEVDAFKTGNEQEGVWGVNPVSAIKNLYPNG